MTGQQWECLLAASHGDAEGFHGKTRMSLTKRKLIVWVSGAGLMPTTTGRKLLEERFAAGQIGDRVAP